MNKIDDALQRELTRLAEQDEEADNAPKTIGGSSSRRLPRATVVRIRQCELFASAFPKVALFAQVCDFVPEQADDLFRSMFPKQASPNDEWLGH